jgi:hypothetical protein
MCRCSVTAQLGSCVKGRGRSIVLPFAILCRPRFCVRQQAEMALTICNGGRVGGAGGFVTTVARLP